MSTALLIGILAISTGCWLLNEEAVKIKVDNRSSEVVCLYSTMPGVLGGSCLDPMEPRTNRARKFGCGEGPGVDKNPLTVAITVQEGNSLIYARTEECRGWQDYEVTLVVEQSGDEVVVTDPLA